MKHLGPGAVVLWNLGGTGEFDVGFVLDRPYRDSVGTWRVRLLWASTGEVHEAVKEVPIVSKMEVLWPGEEWEDGEGGA